MLFDDRLATVLRSAAHSETGARTQYRQLLDLLGSMPEGEAASGLAVSGYERLRELAETLPATVQSAILRAPGLRLRNRALVAFLAESEPQVAAAAMATAQLGESEWLYLIPRLPLTARGFLRHRRDLPFSARQVLERLGVRDLVLPGPETTAAATPATPPEPEPEARSETDAGIGALVRRIEAFQRARRDAPAAPRLPLGDVREPERAAPAQGFDFATDAAGTIAWADPAMAPLVVGMSLGTPRPGATAALDAAGTQAMARRQPLRGVRATLAGPPEVAGEWRIDAAAAFAPATGHFAGYQGRMRRPAAPVVRPASAGAGAADRVRQLLHELRTPVGAIQGFAELIQQQMFGPAPHEYRALAAAIAVDAARLLAGFEELDRLARLEAGALKLDPGESDLREMLAGTLRRLDGVLRPRSARIDLVADHGPFAVRLDQADGLQLVWRIAATLAGALAPGEAIGMALRHQDGRVMLDADLPTTLLADDPFAATALAQPRAIAAGMFGSGFALRLARAEAVAVGGSLAHIEGDVLRLVLPALTGPAAGHTVRREGSGGAAA